MARKRKKSKAKVQAKEAKAAEEVMPSRDPERAPEDARPKKKNSGKKRTPKKKASGKKRAPKQKSEEKKVRPPRKKSAAKEGAVRKRTPARNKVSSTEVTDADGEVTDVDAEVTNLDDKPHDLEEADTGDTLAQLVAAASTPDEDGDGSNDLAVSTDIEADVEDLDAGFEDPGESNESDRLIAEMLPHGEKPDSVQEDARGAVEPGPSPKGSSATAPPDDSAGPGGDVEGGAPALGEVSTPEDRERLLQATLAHAAMQEAVYRVPLDTGQAHRWKGAIASTIFFIAFVVGLSPPGILVPDAPAQLTVADHLYGIRVTLLLQAQQIEAFRTREHRLPDSLADVAATFPGVRFVKSGNRLYQLIAYTPDGVAVVYDSSTPAPEFEAILQVFAPMGVGG